MDKRELIFFAIIALISVHSAFARPKRVKRISDEHLMDLQTRINMNKIDGIAFKMKVAGGKYNMKTIGRKRRAQSRLLDALFNQAAEEQNYDFYRDYEI